jgi:hypothetical protein
MPFIRAIRAIRGEQLKAWAIGILAVHVLLAQAALLL